MLLNKMTSKFDTNENLIRWKQLNCGLIKMKV